MPEAARAIITSTPAAEIKCPFSYDLDILLRLHNRRVVLIGDAVHAKNPTRARGMASGLEDALVLSRYVSTDESVPQLLAAFESERMPIVHEYQRSSRAISMKLGGQNAAQHSQSHKISCGGNASMTRVDDG